MTDSALLITVEQDNSDGFRSLQGFDLNLALDRAGAVDIQYKNGQFEIVLIDKNYRAGEPAVINLTPDGLFDVVQSCRTSWEHAIESLGTTVPDPSGGTKPYHPYENVWDRPVANDDFDALAAKLAVAGNDLFVSIFERNQGTPLDAIATRLREIARSGSRMLTVRTACFHVPWRMLYTHPTGELSADGSNFEPSGFWGFQHVVEQYPSIYPGTDQIRTRAGKLNFAAALHDRIDSEFRVDCIRRHHDFIQSSGDLLSYTEWTKITGLEQGLSTVPFEQQLVYFLCHAEVAGSTASPALVPAALHLADGNIDASKVRLLIKRRFNQNPPLIFINACRGGQLGTLVRQNFTFASQFLEQGAICVVGPQVEVPAVFAGEFGNRFFKRFIERTTPPPQVGLVLREITREMWERNNPFGLVYSLYAGADCHIRWTEEPAA